MASAAENHLIENDMINLGERGKFHMTKGLYYELMYAGMWGQIPQKWHDLFFEEWYEEAYLQSNNPVENRPNVPGEFNARKTSGRLATNAFAAFKRNQKKRILNLGKTSVAKKPQRGLNKRTKKRSQLIMPFNNSANTINAAYNNTAGNITDEYQDTFVKMWAYNFLLNVIKDSRNFSDFERRLEQPLSSGYDIQPWAIQSVLRDPHNKIVIPDTPLIHYFKARLYLTTSQIDKFTEEYLMYRTRNNNSKILTQIPLIDMKKYNQSRLNIGVLTYPLKSAIIKNNIDIVKKILEFRPTLDERLLIDIFEIIEYKINSGSPSISLEILNLIISKYSTINDDVIAEIFYSRAYDINLFTALFEIASIRNDKSKTNMIYEKLLEDYRNSSPEYFNILRLLEEKNIKPPANLFEDTFVKILEETNIMNASENIDDLIEYLAERINPNKGLDADGNTALMMLLRTRYEGFTQTAVNRILTNPALNINKKNDLGETALSIAVKLGKSTLANRLMKIKGVNLESKNIYGKTVLNTIRRGMAAPPPQPPQPAPQPPAVNEWGLPINNNNNNNNNNTITGRTTRRNNYRNMRRTYEKAIKPRIGMTMGAKKVWMRGTKGYELRNLGPNIGRRIASFIPSAANNE